MGAAALSFSRSLVNLRVVCAARDGNVGHSVVEQVFGSQLGIDVDHHPVGGLSLAGMTRGRITVAKVRMLHRIDLDLAVGQLKVGRGRGELHTVSHGEGPLLLTVAAENRRVKKARRLGVPVGNGLTAGQGKCILKIVDGTSL